MKHNMIFFCLILLGCNNSDTDSQFPPNSPEGIIIRIEDANRKHNLDSIIANTDFETSARLTLTETKFPITDSTLYYTAEALKLSEIKQINEKGFAVFEKVKHKFSGKKFINDSIVTIIDESTSPAQEILVVKRNSNWFYLGPK
jgi:hypothetical protein